MDVLSLVLFKILMHSLSQMLNVFLEALNVLQSYISEKQLVSAHAVLCYNTYSDAVV